MKAKAKATKTSIETTNLTASANRFWTVRIDAGKPKVLGKNLPMGVMVFRNCGPGAVHIVTGFTDQEVILPAGETKIAVVRGKIGLAIYEGTSATLEFEASFALK